MSTAFSPSCIIGFNNDFSVVNGVSVTNTDVFSK